MLCLLLLSIVLATSMLLIKTGNFFSPQLIRVVAGAPPMHGAAGRLGHAVEGRPWDPPRLGSLLTSGRFDPQVALRSFHFSSTLR